jgi:hypothetical protein
MRLLLWRRHNEWLKGMLLGVLVSFRRLAARSPDAILFVSFPALSRLCDAGPTRFSRQAIRDIAVRQNIETVNHQLTEQLHVEITHAHTREGQQWS